MRLQILAVGKMKAGPELELYQRFADRVAKSGRSLNLAGPELIEIAESRKSDVPDRKEDEARQLLDMLDSATRIIALDENGKDFSSRDFAHLIRSEQEVGTKTLSFAIGGPDGHGSELLDTSFRKVRFGAMTWPHQLARLMLAEQLYRACTILSGHPYHRD